MLSEKEKKDAKQKKAIDKKAYNKNATLGRKTAFFKDSEKPLDKKKKSDKQDKDKNGGELGKKDIFKDL